VSACRGALYNKDAVTEFLLPPDADGKGGDADDRKWREEAARVLAGNVAGLRDVVEVHLTLDDAEDYGSADADADADAETDGPRWICPVSRKRLRAAPAVYLVPCGHALAAAVVRELDGAGEELACPICAAPCGSGNVIPILSGVEADAERLAARIADLKARGLAHSLKKMPGAGKKRKKKEAQAAEDDAKAKPETGEKNGQKAEAGIKNASTASLTARVMEEQEARNKKRKLQRNDNLDSLFSSRDPSKPPAKRNDFLSRGFTMS